MVLKINKIYIEVLLPIPFGSLFTYKVPDELISEVLPGKRVIVPFGRQKVYSALIKNILHEHANPDSLKEIQSVLDDAPLVNDFQLKLWEWMSEYYMCSQGEVMNSALPSALKLASETKVMLSADADLESEDLTSNEEILVSALSKNHEMTIEEIAGLLKKTSVHQILKKAVEKKLIVISEEINARYKPKLEARLRLAENYKSDVEMENLFQQLEEDSRKKKQQEVLMIFLKFLFDEQNRESVKKSLILSYPEISKSSLQTLISNGILVEYHVQIDRIPDASDDVIPPASLSTIQQTALQEIQTSFEKHDVTLLHGVTSSGKTELYIHLIEEAVKQGKQVLYLLPEIALTTQIITRLQKHFGKSVGVYHSRYTGNERVEVWNHVLNFNPKVKGKHSQIILGARSALFLPYSNLGLIIVDEEHDSSYKQNDPAPRYNGRDTAMVLAKIHGAKTLLGSATPALESYYNAEHDRYGKVELNERHGGVEMPEIVVADMAEARKKKLMKSIFTPVLLESIRLALQNKEQVILFQNRRGFSPFIECRQCNWIPHCKNCSVTLTYHKNSKALKCHYCGYLENLPAFCPNCSDYHLQEKGFGTEKIEEEIAIFFPEARIARMDLDATRTRSSFMKIITEFEDRQIDILVGTQMVTKGLDFDNVSTVGIINADQLLNFPDFRAFERSFQLMLQVSGRSGRKLKRGRVIIQTTQPDHWVITEVVRNNYKGFYVRDLHERNRFGYPPHSRLIEINMRHKELELIQDASNYFGVLLRESLGPRVIGPNLPMVSRIRNQYYRSFIIKVERGVSVVEVKKMIKVAMTRFFSDKLYHGVQIIPDVDPQ
ncbi:MAG: primosomal protein N' [Bacteroidia bacterium]|nr:primosomal protein N' [Bacteroidota bacterium]MBK7573261.1 primosomal protein N' [Bacteroidota bacterium]MBP9922878.1 primosomal protein N' [Bacteroidia bacterium]